MYRMEVEEERSGGTGGARSRQSVLVMLYALAWSCGGVLTLATDQYVAGEVRHREAHVMSMNVEVCWVQLGHGRVAVRAYARAPVLNEGAKQLRGQRMLLPCGQTVQIDRESHTVRKDPMRLEIIRYRIAGKRGDGDCRGLAQRAGREVYGEARCSKFYGATIGADCPCHLQIRREGSGPLNRWKDRDVRQWRPRFGSIGWMALVRRRRRDRRRRRLRRGVRPRATVKRDARAQRRTSKSDQSNSSAHAVGSCGENGSVLRAPFKATVVPALSRCESTAAFRHSDESLRWRALIRCVVQRFYQRAVTIESGE